MARREEDEHPPGSAVPLLVKWLYMFVCAPQEKEPRHYHSLLAADAAHPLARQLQWPEFQEGGAQHHPLQPNRLWLYSWTICGLQIKPPFIGSGPGGNFTLCPSCWNTWLSEAREGIRIPAVSWLKEPIPDDLLHPERLWQAATSQETPEWEI